MQSGGAVTPLERSPGRAGVIADEASKGRSARLSQMLEEDRPPAAAAANARGGVAAH